MARILTMGIVGLLAFGAAAGGSIYLEKARLAEAEKTDETGDSSPEGSPTAETPEDKSAKKDESEDLPIAVRATPASPEEIVRYGMTFKKREEALKNREEELKQERLRLKLVSEDVRAEQRELEGLEQQIRGKLVKAEGILQQIDEKKTEVAKQQQEAKEELDKFDKLQSKIDMGEEENLKRMAAWFQAMEPETAAEYLKELVNDGEMKMAVSILANFEEREASKILAAVNDPALVAQLAREFKEFKRPEKTTLR